MPKFKSAQIEVIDLMINRPDEIIDAYDARPDYENMSQEQLVHALRQLSAEELIVLANQTLDEMILLTEQLDKKNPTT